MAMSVDSNLTAIQSDILRLGIVSFSSEHSKAKADIERRLKREWWPNKGISGDPDMTLITESQFTKAASYLVLWKYALPQLATWAAEDRFSAMLTFYKGLYEEEIRDIFLDGVEYDADDDGLITTEDKTPVQIGRLTR
tara:strand:+ start:316 stop:729 length:414 start_codon:yes stop_codon:yes gene_type:complete